MFFTQVLRNAAVNTATRAIARPNPGIGSSFALNEAKRVGFGVGEWALSLSLILGWPVLVNEYSEHRKWLQTSEEYS